MQTTIALGKSWFGPKETTVVESGEFSASLFTFSTGIEAVRIRNARGEAVILPYLGQHIWSAVFDGRPLKMFSLFEEPRPAASIRDTYGMFMYHCGMLRLGNPTPEDDHPLHGEMPTAKFHTAAIELGEDAEGQYIGVTGAYRYRMGFGDDYDAMPSVRLRAGKGVMDIAMRVHNVGHYPMDLMYMAHINFLAGDDARITQSSGWTVEDMILRTSIPAHIKPSPEYLAFMDKLKRDPGATRVMRKEDLYDPEIVFFLRNVLPGKDGQARFLQTHADGTSDYVSYDPANLKRHVRWILKNKHQRVIGLLPATCEPEGYTAEKKKGNVETLGPGETRIFNIKAGLLSKGETDTVMPLV